MRQKKSGGLLSAILTVCFTGGFFAADNTSIYAQPDSNLPWPMFRHDAMHTGMSPYAGPSEPALSWSYLTSGSADFSPVLGDEGRVYFGSADFRQYALNSNGAFNWSYLTGGTVMSSLLGGDERVYFGSADGGLYALGSNGALDWSYRGGSVVDYPVMGNGGRVYFGTYSSPQNLYALNSDGVLNWSYLADAQVCSSPALGSDMSVYFGSNANRLYALNSNGTQNWSYLTGAMVSYCSPALESGTGTVISVLMTIGCTPSIPMVRSTGVI
ncbi:MAG: PQQ-binding-like beta-propeller repeat protein [Candidatus Aureabacteria bacterium]|nr:PQQ-binding-like beta-propeller repeat protein [Candidatus Auribacterota bacterium]